MQLEDESANHQPTIKSGGAISFCDNETKLKLKKMFFEEDRRIGGTTFETVNKIVKIFYGWFALTLFVLYVFGVCYIKVFINVYLINWSKDLYASNMWEKFYFFAGMMLIHSLLWGIRNWIPLRIGARVSRLIHSKMVYRLLHAKINEFLEIVPAGRIINRFSNDIFKLDTTLIFYMTYFISSLA